MVPMEMKQSKNASTVFNGKLDHYSVWKIIRKVSAKALKLPTLVILRMLFSLLEEQTNEQRVSFRNVPGSIFVR